MEFDVSSGIDSELKSVKEFDFLAQNNEPIISFSPDRCRFARNNSRSSSLDISEFVCGTTTPHLSSTVVDMTISNENTQTLTQPQLNSTAGAGTAVVVGDCIISPTKKNSFTNNYNIHQHEPKQNQCELQRRLEKRIAQASSSVTTTSISNSSNCKPNLQSSNSSTTSSYLYHRQVEYDNQSLGRIASVMLNDSVENSGSSTCVNPIVKMTNNSKSSMSTMTMTTSSSSGFDMKKVPSLLPPQRLAIPHKSNATIVGSLTTSSNNNPKPHSQEKKPLVQWDSEDSEEELSFFPAPKLRSTLTDNLSIDNMSLSGEEDDLHLSPPRSMSNRCPCDPRLLIDSSSKSTRDKNCTIV